MQNDSYQGEILLQPLARAHIKHISSQQNPQNSSTSGWMFEEEGEQKWIRPLYENCRKFMRSMDDLCLKANPNSERYF